MDKYFDYNATTPIDDVVVQSMIESVHLFGNPSSSHRLGKETSSLMEHSRNEAARLLGTDPDKIVFTSGGSESNSMVIKGYLHTYYTNPGHLITSCIEHPSVLEVFNYLHKQFGFEVTFLPVDKHGFVSPSQLRDSIRPDTQLVSIMLANNEIGSIQPIREISEITTEYGIFFHSDAVQAVGKIPLDVQALGVDALSFSAHKLYGPKGIGGLYIKDSDLIEPTIHGGGQERGLRGGTENTLSIIGLGKACELIRNEMESHYAHMSGLRSLFIRSLLDSIPDCQINGFSETGLYLLNTLNVCFRNVNAKLLASQLSNVYKIYVSTGSACSSNQPSKLSHVLQAIGLNEDEIKSSIRISFGKYSSESDVAYLVSALKVLVENMRSRTLNAG
jgi:cysteine desulfurase